MFTVIISSTRRETIGRREEKSCSIEQDCIEKENHFSFQCGRFFPFNIEYINYYGEFLISSCASYLDEDFSIVTEKIKYRFVASHSEGVFIVSERGKNMSLEGEEVFIVKKYSIREKLGVVHWGGNYRLTDDDYLIEGAKQVKKMSIKHFKIYAGRKSDSTYFTENNSKQLIDVLRQPDYVSVFEMGFEKIVIVAHSTFEKSSNYWKLDFTAKDSQQETETFKEVAMELSKYPGTKFIITNWEGDCMVNNDRNSDVYNRMMLWVKARQLGFNLARNKGVTNVYHGLEVNLVAQSVFQGIISVTTEVLPRVIIDYVSYSCYDCKGEEDLNLCVQFIKSKTTANFIFGEFGTPINAVNPEDGLKYFNAVISTVDNLGIELCFYWQIYDNEYEIRDGVKTPRGFGIINPNGICSSFWGLFSLGF